MCLADLGKLYFHMVIQFWTPANFCHCLSYLKNNARFKSGQDNHLSTKI